MLPLLCDCGCTCGICGCITVFSFFLTPHPSPCGAGQQAQRRRRIVARYSWWAHCFLRQLVDPGAFARAPVSPDPYADYKTAHRKCTNRDEPPLWARKISIVRHMTFLSRCRAYSLSARALERCQIQYLTIITLP